MEYVVYKRNGSRIVEELGSANTVPELIDVLVKHCRAHVLVLLYEHGRTRYPIRHYFDHPGWYGSESEWRKVLERSLK